MTFPKSQCNMVAELDLKSNLGTQSTILGYMSHSAIEMWALAVFTFFIFIISCFIK